MKVMLFNLLLTPQHSTISFKVQKHYLESKSILVDLNCMAPSTKYQVSL